MRFIKNILANSSFPLALLGVFLLSGCAGYTVPSEDGIYAQNKPRTTQERPKAGTNSGDNRYEEYFAKQNMEITQAEKYMFGKEEEVFTDIDDYSSGSSGNAATYINSGGDYYGEFSNSPEMEYTRGNGSWGSNPATVNINYYGSPSYGFYGNPYLYRGYYSPWSWGGYYSPWGYPSPYWGGGYLGYGYGYGFHFGFGGFYSPYYRPFYPYGYGGYYGGGYYANPYYTYSRPRSYHYGRRGYRSSQNRAAENTTRRVNTRSARSENNRRAVQASENTRRSARTTATRRNQGTRSNSRATTSRRRSSNATSQRIKNPKNIRAGSSRQSVRSNRTSRNRVGNNDSHKSRSNVFKNSSRRSNTSTRAQRSRRTSTRSRAHSTPARRSSGTSIHRSGGSRSSGGTRSTGGGSRRR